MSNLDKVLVELQALNLAKLPGVCANQQNEMQRWGGISFWPGAETFPEPLLALGKPWKMWCPVK